MTYTPTPEAIQVAARAIAKLASMDWEVVDLGDRILCETIATATLSAAAPIIQAETLRALADEIRDFSGDYIARHIEDMARNRADQIIEDTK